MKAFAGHGVDADGRINGSEALRECYIVGRQARERSPIQLPLIPSRLLWIILNDGNVVEERAIQGKN